MISPYLAELCVLPLESRKQPSWPLSLSSRGRTGLLIEFTLGKTRRSLGALFMHHRAAEAEADAPRSALFCFVIRPGRGGRAAVAPVGKWQNLVLIRVRAESGAPASLLRAGQTMWGSSCKLFRDTRSHALASLRVGVPRILTMCQVDVYNRRMDPTKLRLQRKRRGRRNYLYSGIRVITFTDLRYISQLRSASRSTSVRLKTTPRCASEYHLDLCTCPCPSPTSRVT